MILRIKKRFFNIIGLMSGTSHDGVDAALVELRPNNARLEIKIIKHIHNPYKGQVRDKIRKAFNSNTEHICRLNFELGEIFADAVLSLIDASGYKKNDIDVIASHGQTIYHIPPLNGKKGSTLQIGESSVIAERTGILTISDFRTRDMAAGGQGAPLVPIADHFLFKKKGFIRAVLNIGGISNVTIVNERLDNTIAFDIGPGNSLMDEAVKLYSNGRLLYDNKGFIAKKGRPDKRLLNELLAYPYFKRRPPKSTGREEFGADLVKDILKRYHMPIEDILSTFVHLTSMTIMDAIIPYKPHEVILTGGGVKNLYLISLIKKIFVDKGIIVKNISDYGITAEAKEAVSFAIIGYLTLNMQTGNIPSATGAKHEVILGKIVLP